MNLRVVALPQVVGEVMLDVLRELLQEVGVQPQHLCQTRDVQHLNNASNSKYIQEQIRILLICMEASYLEVAVGERPHIWAWLDNGSLSVLSEPADVATHKVSLA